MPVRSFLHRIALLMILSLMSGCGGSDTTNQSQAPNPTQPIPFEPHNEPYFGYQWYIDVNRSFLQQYGYDVNEQADANITAAWDHTRGKNVTVAIIDDGIDLSHLEFRNRSIITYNADYDTHTLVYPLPGQTQAHGNHIAGIIAAALDRHGIVGIAPDVNLVFIQQTIYSDINTIRAFEFARQAGAKVINCSWGTYHVSDAVAQEIQRLYNEGITVVFAAGNDDRSLDDTGIDDESELPSVIGVGASDETNDVAWYSNYGSAMDIIAPGGDTAQYLGMLATDDSGTIGDDNQLGLVDNDYAFVAGSSFAAPVVTATVALMYAANPALTPYQIRRILIQTADKIGASNAAYDANGFDYYRAYGKLNAGKAVKQASRQ